MQKVIKDPHVVIAIISIITVFLGYNIKNIQIDNDSFKFIPETDPARVAIDDAKEIFGSSDNLSVGIEAKRGSIFTKEELK